MMAYISLAGIIVGVAVFIILCAKNVNTLLAGICGALIICFTSGNNILEMITGTWTSGFSGFVKSYFLQFALGSLFGKCLSDSGAARRIALGIYSITTKFKGNPRFVAALFVPVMYMICSYVGVSGFVVVYTVLPIAKYVYYQANVPWRMFTYGGATFLVTMLLPGNLQLNNIAAAGFCGTDVAGGGLMGLFGACLVLVLHLCIIYWDVKRSEKRGEGYIDTGRAFLEANPEIAEGSVDTDTSKLPNLLMSWLPIIVMIVCAAVIKWHIVVCMTVGIALIFILMPGRIKKPVVTITEGMTSCFNPILTVSAASALGTCLKAAQGYTVISDAVATLPSVIGGCIMIAVMCFCAGSSSGGLNPVGAEVFSMFTNAGLTPGTSQVLMTASAFFSVPPQSAGILNTGNLCKLEYKVHMWNYMRLEMISGLITWIVLIAMVQFGIFT